MSEILKDYEWAILSAIYGKADYRFYGKEAVAAQKMSHNGLVRPKSYGEYKVTKLGQMLYEQERTRREHMKGNRVVKQETEVRQDWSDGGMEVYCGPEQRMVHSRRRVQGSIP